MKTGIKALEKAASSGITPRVRTNKTQRWIASIFLYLSCVTASAAFVAVEFAGRVTFSQQPGWHVGQRVTGYFTYESDTPPTRQTSSRPNLVFETPENQGRYEYSSYDFTVYNNWSADPFGGSFQDGVMLRFSWCCTSSSYGFLSFFSSNTSLFPNNLLPHTFPALSNFDAGRGLTLTREDVQPYQTTFIRIDHLLVVPQPNQPLVHGWERNTDGISFRFLTAPSASYTVQFKDSLADSDWQTLTNIASAREPIVTIRDTGLQQRFYRIRRP